MASAMRSLPGAHVTSGIDRGAAVVIGRGVGKRQSRPRSSGGGGRNPSRQRRPMRTSTAPLPGPVILRTRDALCARLPTEGRAGPGWSGRIRPFARRAYRDFRHGNCRRRNRAGRLRRGLRRRGRGWGIGHDGSSRRRHSRWGRGSRHRGRGRCRGSSRRRRHLSECGTHRGLRGRRNDRAELAQSARAGAGSLRACRGDERQREKRHGERRAQPPRLTNQMISHDQVLHLRCAENPYSIPKRLGIPCYLWYFHCGIGRKGRRRHRWESSCPAGDSAANWPKRLGS